LHEFGDGQHCACVYCGRVLDKGTLTQDKIYVANEGGRYRMPNLLPACMDCNAHRNDAPIGSMGLT
jgi:5-methylcytosine-specific restriction endonuclease McrA